MSPFGLRGIMKAHPGQRDELLDVLLEAADLVASVRGDPDAIWVSEVWRSEADHMASLTDEGVRAIIGRARSLIAGF